MGELNSQEGKDLLSIFSRHIDILLRDGLEKADRNLPDSVYFKTFSEKEKRVYNLFFDFIDQVKEFYLLQKSLAAGDLSFTVTNNKNSMLAPALEMQAKLKHLTWQARQIINGDFRQTVTFMEDFSKSFNSIVASLSEKVTLEKQLATGKSKFLTITSILGDGVITTDRQGIITFINQSGSFILGYENDELENSLFHKSVSGYSIDGEEIPENRQFIFSVIDNKRVYKSDETAFKRKDGAFIPVYTSCAPIIEENVCIGTVTAFYDITEQKNYQHSLELINGLLEQQATTDNLTGVFNRQYFNSRLEAELERAKRYDSPVSLIIFDIDHFKRVNDDFGHLEGDNVLKDLSKLVKKKIRPTDLLARWGGEEFVVLVPEHNLATAFIFADRIRIIVENNDFTIPRKVTCSFGVAEFEKSESLSDFLNRADHALYKAKEAGRNRVEALQTLSSKSSG